MKTPSEKSENYYSRLWTWAAFSLLAFLWIYTAFHYTALPPQMPVHFNTHGEADRYGPKTSIWSLLISCTAIIALLTAILLIYREKRAGQTPGNKAFITYQSLTGLLQYLRFAVALIYTIITVYDLRQALHKELLINLGTSFIIFIQALLLIPAIYYAYSYKKRLKAPPEIKA